MKSLTKLCAYNFSFRYPCPRKLREIMKLSLIEKENQDKIKYIWMEFHKDRPNEVSYVISKREYELLTLNTKASPMFMIPIKKKGGHYILVGQNQEKCFLFTYLEDYKKFKTNASPYFILTLFDELLFKKDLVLVRGDIMDLRLNKADANWIMNQTFKSYLTPEYYQDLVYHFNHDTEKFNYEKFKIMYDL